MQDLQIVLLWHKIVAMVADDSLIKILKIEKLSE